MKDLKKLLPSLRDSSDVLIWTAGDSSLDNKYWYDNGTSGVLQETCHFSIDVILPLNLGLAIGGQPLEPTAMFSSHQYQSVM